ncbi:helix-turn-helix transcriptional regulator [Phenylobacterium sp.]|uniref:helix-turn-helix transcriptional regulator n=1 Tax=Phenylobacterium sp. TaxID=1871053 RepID=UPI002FC837A1
MDLAAQALPIAHFSTDDIEPASRFESWRAAVGGLYDVHHPFDVEGFSGQASSVHLGGLILGQMQAASATYERSKRRIALDGLDHIIFGVSGSGDHGRVTVQDMSQPFEMPDAALEGFCLIVPRHIAARGVGGPNRLHGFGVANPTGGLAASFLTSVVATAPRLSPRGCRQLASAVMELLTAAIGVDGSGRLPVRRRSKRLKAGEYIEANLADLTLCADKVARDVGVSRSVLYGLFKDEGGVGKYIQSRRLAWANRLLVEDSNLRIADIAEICCFSSESHFSRAFRAWFGAPPREARKSSVSSGVRTIVARRGDAETFSTWVRTLRADL